MTTHETMQGTLFVLRIIVGSMIAGVVLFAFVVLAACGVPVDPPESTPVLFGVLVAFAASGIVGSVVVHHVMLARARQASWHTATGGDPTIFAIRCWQTCTIISTAVAESFGFFAVVVYLMTGSQPALLVAALAVALMALRFPTQNRADLFISQVADVPTREDQIP